MHLRKWNSMMSVKLTCSPDGHMKGQIRELPSGQGQQSGLWYHSLNKLDRPNVAKAEVSLFFVSFTSHISIPFISHPFISTFCPCNLPQNKIKENLGKKKKGKKGKTSSWKLYCDTASHTVYPFIHLSLLASVHC